MKRDRRRDRRAGISIPLFSLRSSLGWGIGEMGDIPFFADWLRSGYQSVLQILPLNEMAPDEASPYSALSAMAIGTLAPPMDAGAGLAHFAERSRVWRKFVRNPAAIAGALILLVVIGAAIFAPYVAPHEHTRQSLIRRLTPPVWAET